MLASYAALGSALFKPLDAAVGLGNTMLTCAAVSLLGFLLTAAFVEDKRGTRLSRITGSFPTGPRRTGLSDVTGVF